MIQTVFLCYYNWGRANNGLTDSQNRSLVALSLIKSVSEHVLESRCYVKAGSLTLSFVPEKNYNQISSTQIHLNSYQLDLTKVSVNHAI